VEMKISNLFASCTILVILPSFVFSYTIHMEADKLIYDVRRDSMVAISVNKEMNVRLKTEDVSIKANNIVVNLKDRYFISDGEIEYFHPNFNFRAEKLNFNLSTLSGEASRISSQHHNLYIYGSSLTQKSTAHFHIEDGLFTTCNLPKPHYWFSAKSINLRPNDKLVASGIKFYLRGLPVFYLPVYWKFLKEKRLHIISYPGYNSYQGVYIKNILGYPVTDKSYGKFYLDYLSKKGIGYGLEYTYYLDNLKGSILGYNMYEVDTRVSRNKIIYNHWQSLFPRVVLSGSINYLSDNLFHRDYLSEEWVQVASTLKTAVGTSYNYRNCSIYLLFEREDFWDSNKKKYLLKSMALPKVAFSTQLKQIYKLPLFYSLAAEIKNNYTATFINQFLLNLGTSLLYRKSITRQLHTTFSIGSNCTYAPQAESAYKGRKLDFLSIASSSIKYNLSNTTDLNMTYNFDHTISSSVANSAIAFDIVAYRKKMEFISGAKYNFLNKSWDTLYIDTSYNISPLHLTTKLLLNYNFYNDKLSYLSLETRYGRISDNYYIVLSVNYPFIGQMLKMKYNVRVKVRNNFNFYITHWGNLHFYTKHYTFTATDVGLEKDLHCWLGKLYLRQRGMSYEGWLTLEIKSHFLETTRNYILEKEKEWYPYREK